MDLKKRHSSTILLIHKKIKNQRDGNFGPIQKNDGGRKWP